MLTIVTSSSACLRHRMSGEQKREKRMLCGRALFSVFQVDFQAIRKSAGREAESNLQGRLCVIFVSFNGR